jgi:hypothetical protein
MIPTLSHFAKQRVEWILSPLFMIGRANPLSQAFFLQINIGMQEQLFSLWYRFRCWFMCREKDRKASSSVDHHNSIQETMYQSIFRKAHLQRRSDHRSEEMTKRHGLSDFISTNPRGKMEYNKISRQARNHKEDTVRLWSHSDSRSERSGKKTPASSIRTRNPFSPMNHTVYAVIAWFLPLARR